MHGSPSRIVSRHWLSDKSNIKFLYGDLMDISIGSYSFHRLLESGKQDIFGYITDCKRLGCTQLDPWNGHLPLLQPEADQIMKGEAKLTADEEAWVKKVRAASDEAGVPFGCVAIDGGHIYEA